MRHVLMPAKSFEIHPLYPNVLPAPDTSLGDPCGCRVVIYLHNLGLGWSEVAKIVQSKRDVSCMFPLFALDDRIEEPQTRQQHPLHSTLLPVARQYEFAAIAR